MARFFEKTVGQLARGWLLAPERYDRPEITLGGVPLPELAELASEIVTPRARPVAARTRVLDTGDALAGFARATEAAPQPSFRSNKKRLRPGDVIVSRLRPYLRQVAYLDAALFEDQGQPVDVVASSEFFVLRGTATRVAFLVPWLLSPAVQARLAAAQEGGHHPRVARETLLALELPGALVARRDELSRRVEEAVAAFRQSESMMRELSAEA